MIVLLQPFLINDVSTSQCDNALYREKCWIKVMHQNRKLLCVLTVNITFTKWTLRSIMQSLELKLIPLYTQQRYICLCIQIYWYEGKYASIQCTCVNNVSENRKQYKKIQHRKRKRWATRTPQKTRMWTQVLAKGKQFLLLIRHPPC